MALRWWRGRWPRANFLPLSLSEALHATLGASERQLAAAFRAARRCAPTLIFVDGA